MFEFEGKKYILDLRKISDFVNYSDSHPSKEYEVIDSYQPREDSPEDMLNTKTVREVTTQGNSQLDNIRYDIIKLLLFQLFGNDIDDEGISTTTFGFEIAFNTLIKEGFLIEI